MPLPNQDISRFRDHFFEVAIFRGRLLFAFLVVLGLFGVLVARYHDLQVRHHEKYVTIAEANRIHTRPVAPVRGLIVDSQGNILADNKPNFKLSIIPERSKDLAQTFTRISELIHLSEDDINRFNKQLNYKRRPYEAVPLRYNLTEEEIALIAVNEFALNGVKVEADLLRSYPHNALYAHVLGYVGRINTREVAQFSEEEAERYRGTYHIGKIGVEKFYEDELHGQPGFEHVETNVHGRVTRTVERENAQSGQDLVLHLRHDVQRVAERALAGRRGAVVAMDVSNGGVLAMVSTPSFDPNLFVTGISFKDYDALRDDLDLPLYNRSLQAQYPPGSTLKPMLGLAALDSGITTFDKTIRDPGFYKLDNDPRLYRDWKEWGHGHAVDLNQAIRESCDTYFYDMAHNMGVDLMHEAGSRFGLGMRTQLDIVNERAGLWPSRAWKRGARGQVWFPGDNLNMSIGQGAVLTTPLQLAVMTSGLATRGRTLRPKLVKHFGAFNPLADSSLIENSVLDNLSVYLGAESNWDYVYKAMTEVLHHPKGTAYAVGKDMTYLMAGKTGTAQVVGIAQGEKYDSEALRERNRDHALFIGFAPVEAPKIAIAVVLENAEKSSKAALVARTVADHYLGVQTDIQTAALLPASDSRSSSSVSSSTRTVSFTNRNASHFYSHLGSTSQELILH